MKKNLFCEILSALIYLIGQIRPYHEEKPVLKRIELKSKKVNFSIKSSDFAWVMLVLISSLFIIDSDSSASTGLDTWNCKVSENKNWDCYGINAPNEKQQPEKKFIKEKIQPSNDKQGFIKVSQKKENSIFQEISFKEETRKKESVKKVIPKKKLLKKNPIISFNNNLDKNIDWNSCSHGKRETPEFSSIKANSNNKLPLNIEADSVEGSTDKNISVFKGKVSVSQGKQKIWADYMTYSKNNGDLYAKGNALLEIPDFRMAANEISYNLDSKSGEGSHAQYRWPLSLSRGSADKVRIIDQNNSYYKNTTYTTCSVNNNDWLIDAEYLEVNRATGMATARNAKLSLFGIPVGWTPWLTYPIDDRRRSGILSPSYGSSEKHGSELVIPYYFNLAENYDFTLSSRIMSKRGLMIGSEYRFLSPIHEGIFGLDVLPDDREDSNETTRYLTSFKIDSKYNKNLSSEIKYSQTGDKNFLSDFGSGLYAISTKNLERNAQINYDTDNWNVMARIQSYQSLSGDSNGPYKRLPQITFNYDERPIGHSFAYELNADFTHFSKNGSAVQGNRIDVMPTIKMPVREAHYHFIPSFSLQNTNYNLDNQTVGLDSNISRIAPIFSLDGGLYFDRSTSIFEESVTQTLEPRLFYLYVPEKNQSNIPIFDTGKHGFNFNSLFRENRFNGPDRLGDANQLSVAIISRLNHDKTGRELLKARFGGIFYQKDRKVQLPGTAVDTKKNSPLIADLSSDLGNGWTGNAEIQSNADVDDINKFLVQANFSDTNKNLANLAYKYTPDDTHTDMSIIWEIDNKIRALGRWNYSISDSQNIETLAGLEYGHCCWRARTILREQKINGKDELSVWLQFEISGLTNFGDDIDNLLGSSIRGYQKEND